MKIGFIGLGVMGSKMASNLLNKGYALTLMVTNRNRKVIQHFREKGAYIVQSPMELAQNSEIIMTSLPNENILREVIFGNYGLINGVKPSTVLIDVSSITPKASQQIAKELQERQVDFLDAPVSGGAMGAETGTLTIMVGGKKEVFESVRPILEAIGNKIYHMGSVGSGDMVKIVNNLLLGINMAAVSEALNLGLKAGIDIDLLYEIISQSSGNSYALQAKFPKIKAQSFEPGFTVNLHYKDLQLAIDAAKDLNKPLLLGNLTQQIYKIAQNKGLGEQDISSLISVNDLF